MHVLFLFLACALATDVVVVVDVSASLSAEQETQYKHQLKHAFDYYMSAPSSGADRVALFQFTNTPDAPLTHQLSAYVSIKDKPTAHQAINNLEFVATGCANWCMGLEYAARAGPGLIYLVVDENPCPVCTETKLREFQRAHPHTRIFPVGVGANVGDAWLRAAAAPCTRCVKDKDYLHASSL